MFEDLKRNIYLLEQHKDSIAVESLLDSMCRLFYGAGEANPAIADIHRYGNCLVNLFDCILPSYRQAADQLKQLNDEDVDDVISSSKQILDNLMRIRPILEQLSKEKDKYAALQEDYQQKEQERVRLQAEVDRLKKIPIEAVNAAKEALQRDLDLYTENAALFEQVRKDLEQAKKSLETVQADTAQLEKEKEMVQRQQKDAQNRVERMRADIDGLEKVKKFFEQKGRNIAQAAAESANALTVMKNAWESIRLREDLPSALESVGELCSFGTDITSFSELEQWFDRTGTGLEKALTAYTEMYRKMLGILSKTVE